MSDLDIKFCHISPTLYLEEYSKKCEAHLILAHLVEEDETYRDFYKNLNDGKDKIMDNSAYELFRRGKSMYDPTKLVGLGKEVGANYVVLSDYPNEPGEKTIAAAKELIPEFVKSGFKTFFTPQSQVGEIEDYIQTFEWGLKNADIVGVSIIGVPNAFGCLDNKLQRYLSRKHLIEELEVRHILTREPQLNKNKNKLHFLGLLDGPNEIKEVHKYRDYIRSWDSSSAVWYGLNGHMYDESPTGQIDGKYERDVDFDFDAENKFDPTLCLLSAHTNVDYINSLCKNMGGWIW
jgi:hypothetical protein